MDIRDLIIDEPSAGVFRVHRSTMTSQELFDLEQERIFERCWLYLGHESEVPNPGDFLRRTVAGRPLLFIRGNDGQIRAFYNTCTHRGALICRQDQGHAEVFQCFYHAWSFNTAGELVGLPDEAGYGAGFDRAERALRQPPRLAHYRGLYFVSFNPNVVDLPTYLGGAREYIDLVMDQAESGMRIVPGSNKYAIRANWKLLAENSLDGYHGLPTHQTYWEYMQSLGVNTTRDLSRSRARDLGNGHAVIESPAPYGRPIAHWSPLFGEAAKPEIERIRARLVERYGPERAERMASTIRNLLIYPNLVLNDIMSITVRIFWPVQPDLMEVTAWEMAPAEEREDLLARRLDSFLTFLGPGGFATPDDTEALESCQMGFRAREVEWSDISRGMHRQAINQDELQMRAFWRQWHADMLGIRRTDRPEPGNTLAASGLPAR
jgi:p-cumate 2,3-dioxygenase alpha subunit